MLERERGGSEAIFAEGMSLVERRLEQLRDGSVDPEALQTYVIDLENVHEELRVADEEIRAQQEELERLLELQSDTGGQQARLIAALPAAVLVTDRAALIRMANPAAVELLATRRDELVGKPFPALVTPEDRSLIRKLVGAVNTGEDGFRALLTLQPRQAVRRRVEVLARAADGLGGGRTLTWLLLEGSEEGTHGPARVMPLLAGALTELTRVPLHSSGKPEVLTNVASICAHALGPDVAVSVHVGPPAHPDHVGSDSRLAQELDGAQMIAGEGPSHTAWESREPVVSEDLRTDPRWPRLADRIRNQRVGGVIALPVRLDDRLIGNLNVYAAPGRRMGEQVRVAELMAQTVAAILHELDQRAELEALASQLRDALRSRAVIDQAKGMIMMRERCDADAAFKKLVQMSSRANVKLRVVAQQIVDSAVKG